MTTGSRDLRETDKVLNVTSNNARRRQSSNAAACHPNHKAPRDAKHDNTEMMEEERKQIGDGGWV